MLHNNKKMNNLHFIPNNILTKFIKELTKYKMTINSISIMCIYIYIYIGIVRAGNETIGLSLTWAHNLFIRWALGFPTLGRSRHRDSK